LRYQEKLQKEKEELQEEYFSIMNIRSEKEDNKMDIEIDNSDNLSNLLNLKLKENENKEIVKESIK